MNDDLIAPLESESFKASGISGEAQYDLTGGFTSDPTVDTLPITFIYDAEAKTYSISVDGRSQTFGEADIDAVNSTDQLLVYVKSDGVTSESLTLTKAGTSGPLTYQYVGGGFWERATLTSTTADATADAFTYGVVTADAAVPRTGSARYDIDIMGLHPSPLGTIEKFSGSGGFDIDFARGTFALRGDMSGDSMPVTQFVGDGRLSATLNGFAGEIRFIVGGSYHVGPLNGLFYGPNGGELGGVWSATPAGQEGWYSTYMGIILGRKDEALATPASFAELTSSTFLGGTGARVQKIGSATPTADANLATVVHYDAGSGIYTVFDPDRAFYDHDDFHALYEPDRLPTDDPTLEEVIAIKSLDYVRSAEWFRRQHRGGFPNYRIEHLVFGFATPDADTPRTGSGFYDIDVAATLLENGGTGLPVELSGAGQFLADFASGEVSLTGTIGVPSAVGAFQGSGTISSTANAFDGAIEIDMPLDGAFSGSFAGALYGPTAENVGATFTGAGTSGVLAGSFVGTRNGSVPPGSVPIVDFTEELSTSDLYYSARILPDNGNVWNATVEWDPTADTFRFVWDTATDVDETFGAAEFDALASDTKFDVFKKDSGGYDYTAKVYKPGNPEVALTYASFVEIRQHWDAPSGLDKDVIYYGLLGKPSASHELPQFGSASYSGVAHGSGMVRAMSGEGDPLIYAVTGTSALSVNFQTQAMTGSIALAGTDQGGGSTNFGSWDLIGNVTSSAAFSLTTGMSVNGIEGYFFGPHAQEYAGAFHFSYGDDTTYTDLFGIAVGKQVTPP